MVLNKCVNMYIHIFNKIIYTKEYLSMSFEYFATLSKAPRWFQWLHGNPVYYGHVVMLAFCCWEVVVGFGTEAWILNLESVRSVSSGFVGLELGSRHSGNGVLPSVPLFAFFASIFQKAFWRRKVGAVFLFRSCFFFAFSFVLVIRLTVVISVNFHFFNFLLF